MTWRGGVVGLGGRLEGMWVYIQLVNRGLCWWLRQ